MGKIPESIVSEVQQASDLVEFISADVVLKRSGKGFKGLCPFHAEKTPSFNVDPVRQFFHCFGCKAGGTVFTYLMKRRGLAFPEAVRHLADRAGIRVPETSEDSGAAQERDAHYQTNRWARGQFEKLLKSDKGDPGKQYFKHRGITGKTAVRFHLGYAVSGGLTDAAREEGVAPAALQKAGLAGTRDNGETYETFRNRVVFPITDLQERVVGFGGRTLGDGVPKYLNTPQTPVFHKGKLLYGLAEARQAISERGEALVVEGYMDCLMAHQHGVDWAVATLGTALTEDHARLLGRFAQRILLVFDPDEAGQKASLRSLEIFAKAGLGVRVAVLPAGQDPSDFLLADGKEKFLKYLEKAEDLVAFRVRNAKEQGEWDTAEGKSRVVRELVGWAGASPDAIQRQMVLKRVAEVTGLAESMLAAEADRGRPGAKPVPPLKSRAEAPAAAPEKLEDARKHLLRLLMERGFAPRVLETMGEWDFQGSRYERVAARVMERARANGHADVPVLQAEFPESEEAERLAEILSVEVEEAGRERMLAEILGAPGRTRSLRRRREYSERMHGVE